MPPPARGAQLGAPRGADAPAPRPAWESRSLISDALAGCRVLVVDDEALIAMNVQDMLDELGCVVVAAPTRVEEALAVVEDGGIDAVLLDVNLHGRPSFPVADALAARQVPFVFATGYGTHILREDLRDRPLLPKPFRLRDLERVLAGALAARQ
ncbi:MAG: response regulator [Acetobacteraceae bacterium]|nr:response regulator [Acetobacteraceae bacterium]